MTEPDDHDEAGSVSKTRQDAQREATSAEPSPVAKIKRMEAFLAQVKRSANASADQQNWESGQGEQGVEEQPQPMRLETAAVPETVAVPETAGASRSTSIKKILRLLVLNGPNLNLLGSRETDLYGRATLTDIENQCRKQIQGMDVTLDFFQSNHEGGLVDRIQQARGKIDLIIINPAAYTHTSVAIRDALLAVEIPVIEVHLSNIHKREPFRHHSYISDIALGQIVGLGPDGYRFAIEAGLGYLTK